MSISDATVELIMHDEGTGPVKDGRLMPYRDSRGFLTIGYGRCIDKIGISAEEAKMLLMNDLEEVELQIAKMWPWMLKQTEIRYQVMVSLVFNMGQREVCQFKKMLAFWEANDYDRAADELHASDWYMEVGGRGPKLVWMLRYGTIPVHHLLI